MNYYSLVVYFFVWCSFVPVAVAQEATPKAPAVPSAEALALRLFDSEALYTLANGLKPISEGYWTIRYPETEHPHPSIALVRQRLESLPWNEEFQTGVYMFSAVYDGQRTAAAFIAHKAALRKLIEAKREFFQSIDITPSLDAQAVLEQIDLAQRAKRWRAYGYVFGYPDHAVDFFVEAGESQDRTKKFVERDFIRLPTHTSSGGRFVYAVPKGHTANEVDIELRRKAEAIYNRYQFWRGVYLGDGTDDPPTVRRAGSVAMLRDWLAPPIPAATFYHNRSSR